MKFLQWLGFAEKQSAPTARAPALGEIGTTGTPIFGGYLRDLGEYNPTLEGLAAFSTYEKMRRSDGQVAATLAAMKLPIRAAEWAVVEPEDASPIEIEAADFVRECLFEGVNFKAAIENALLMLDFGCSAHEDVWYVDGNRVRLRKLAARLPVTFQRWIVDENEGLAGIEQYGAKADTYVTATVPMDKLALFTFQQEGSNFAGRSVLRPMYQHWYIKSGIYKIDAISCERNGMGVPWIKMGQDPKAEDIRTAHEWVQRLTAHERTGIVLPPGWEFGLEGVKGSLRDPKDSIAHHNIAISKTGLAQFIDLGQSESGNRALGQTMGDFFYLSLQATADVIGRVMTLTTIRRLVDYNFGVQTRGPQLVAQKILALKFQETYAALKDLAGAGLVQADDELEAYLRKQMGLPEAGKSPRPQPQRNNPTEGSGGGEPGAAGRKSSARLAESGPRLLRQPRGPEKCLALAEIVSELDRGRDEVAAAIRRARPAIQAEIVNKVVNAPIREMHRVSVPPDQKVIDQVEEILRGVYDFGHGEVQAEKDRQAAGGAAGDAATIRGADLVRKLRKVREPLGVYADAVVSEVINTLTQRAVNVALDWMRRPGDLSKGEIIRKIETDLDEQSDKWIDGAAAKGANEAFADGRAAGYEAYRDEIGQVIYSALLDINCCGNCAAADDASGATPDEIPDVPNPDCDGGDKCRCVHVFVFSDEVRQ